MAHDISFNIEGYEIKAQTFGHMSKPAILSLHGWLDNSNSFLELARELEQDYYIIAIDLPGHGHSSHLPKGMHYHFVDCVMIINDLIKRIEHDDIILMGHSMGACMASLAAPFVSKALLALVLIEGLGPLTHHPEETAKYLRQYINKINHTIELPLKKMKHIDEAAVARSRRGHVSFEIAKTLCQRGTVQKDDFYYWRHDPRLLIGSPLRMTEDQVLDCLGEIRTPTLLIEAEQGFDFGEPIMAKRIEKIKNITLKKVSGGHHVHMEEPKKIASLIKDFLSSKRNHTRNNTNT